MSLSHSCKAVGKRWRHQGGAGQPFDHGIELEAAVEPVAELSEVARQMLGVHCVIGAMQGVLDVAQGGVDPVQPPVVRRRRPTANRHGVVRTTDQHYRAEAAQPIAHHQRAWRHVALRPRHQCVGAKALDHRHPHSHGAAIFGAADRRYKRRLSLCPATGSLSSPLATPVRVVELNHAFEWVLFSEDDCTS